MLLMLFKAALFPPLPIHSFYDKILPMSGKTAITADRGRIAPL